MVALRLALDRLAARGEIGRDPVIEHVAAISAGRVEGELLLDLAYEEDARAEMDMNLAQTESGRLVEIQATAEGLPFTFEELARLREVAGGAIAGLIRLQQAAVAGARAGG
jgi:ribonuclease PH